MDGHRQECYDAVHRDTWNHERQGAIMIGANEQHTVVYTVATCGHEPGDVLRDGVVRDAVMALRTDRRGDKLVPTHRVSGSRTGGEFEVDVTHRPML